MKKILLLITIFILPIFNSNILSQPFVAHKYHYNDIYSIAIDEVDAMPANHFVWLGTRSGVVMRELSNPANTPIVFTKNDGLSSNFITAIAVQDDNGNSIKWFGSFDNGITRYDGADFDIYNNETEGINNQINSITIESDGNVWFASFEYVYRYNEGEGFQSYLIEQNKQVISIYADEDNLYCITKDALWEFNGSSSFTEISQTTMNLSGSFDLTSLLVKEDEVYVGTNGEGIAYYNGSNWGTPQAPGNQFINYLCINPNDDYVTAVTENGAFWTDGTWAGWQAMWTMNDIRVFACDNSGAGWAGFAKNGNGVQRASDYSATGIPGPFVHADIGEELLKSDINALQYDGTNTIVIATNGGGLCTYDGTNWNNYINTGSAGEIPSNIVKDVSITASARYWVATNEGVGYFNGATWMSYTGANIPSNNVNAIEGISAAEAWIGTEDAGVGHYTGSPIWVDYDTGDGLLNNKVIGLKIVAANNIWALHDNGISVWNGSSWATNYDLTAIGFSASERLTDIDSENTSTGIWITSTAGVAYFDGASWQVYNAGNSELSEGHIISVFIDDTDVKYFGTKNHGISIFNGTSWAKISMRQGLATNNIKAIYSDNSGSSDYKIWTGGEWGGLSIAEITELTVFAGTDDAPNTICQNDNVDIYAFTNGGFGNFTYSWSSEPPGFVGDTRIISVAPQETTLYKVTVSDGINTISDDMGGIINVKIVTPSIINGADTVCEHTNDIVYSVHADANKTYEWWIEGGEISQGGTISESVHVNWFDANDNAAVNLTEYDIDIECSLNTRFNVTVGGLSTPEILLKGENLLICTDSGSNYQWLHDEEIISGAVEQFYSIPTTGNRNGNYSVHTKSKFGCISISNIITIDGTTVKIYPNPSSDIVNIDINNNLIGNGTLKILDANGKTIYTENFNKQEKNKLLNINLDNNLHGIYYINIFIDDKFCLSKKMIVN